MYSSSRSVRMIRAPASISARWENACGKLPRCLPVLRVELLGVQAQRRGDAEQALHQIAGALAVADDRERRHEPERADQEAALLARQAVVGLVGAVAQDEAVLGQVVGDRLDGLSQALVVTRQETEERRQQGGRVERVRVVVLAQHAVAHAVFEDVRLDLVGGGAPGLLERRVAGDMRQLRGAVERDPAHQLRGHVVLRVAAGLPDALVGIPPDLCRALRLALDDRPQPPRHALAATRMEQDRVERRPEDVVLALVEGPVADPHRVGSGVARELVARGLGEVAAPVDPVHDLERAVVVRLEVGDELHELVGLPVQIQEVQRLQREGRVADPGEAVVPVALTARRLRQRGGERRDGGAGRHVREALDRQRRALDRPAPAVVDGASTVQPVAPVGRGGGQASVGLVDVLRGGELLGPRKRAIGLLALLEGVPGPDPFALDSDRHVGLEPDRLPGAGRVGRVAAIVDQRPLRRRASVVEDRLAHHVDLDTSLQAEDRAHEHVVAVLVGGRARVRRDLVLVVPRTHGQRVANHYPARGGVPGREQGVRAGLVDARRRDVDSERAQAEAPCLAVEQRAEDARRVEARHAEPVDRPVGRDQRAGVAVGQERVVGDRRERRGSGGALRQGGFRGLAVPACLGFLLLAVLMTPPRDRATRRVRRRAHPPPSGPRIPSRTHARAEARRGAAASRASIARRCPVA